MTRWFSYCFVVMALGFLADPAGSGTLGICSLSSNSGHECPLRAAAGEEESEHDHDAEVNRRGDAVMGFDHMKTTHHFLLNNSGGKIQVSAKIDSDAESIAKIRAHLKEIAALFKAGDFAKPMAIHGQIPSGASTMKSLKSEIEYKYVEIRGGAQVEIITSNEEARKAIHEFLRFQIQDHDTGDPMNGEAN